MKNIWISIVVVVISIIGMIVLASAFYRYEDSTVLLEGDEEIYVLTEQEADRINANSNLLGCVLLGEVPEEYDNLLMPIRPDELDYYSSFPYRDEQYITGITLVSEDANIFGISVGDKVNSVSSVMLEEGYIRQYTATDITCIIYRKHYICIVFDFNEEGILVEQGVCVEDPAWQNIEY